MATMWRPRSDNIGRLQHQDIIIGREGSQFNITLHAAREPKEAQVKTTVLGEFSDKELCPVYNLRIFIFRTSVLRQDLEQDHTLFLTYLDQEDKPSTSVRPTTVANWIKQALNQAGIDTSLFQAHSLRAASSTKAVELGNSIQAVKKHANSSLNSDMFEKFYFKPSSQRSSTATINNSIFSSTENSITLEVGLESTGISLGTTSNTTNVDGTKTENVKHARPWLKRWW